MYQGTQAGRAVPHRLPESRNKCVHASKLYESIQVYHRGNYMVQPFHSGLYFRRRQALWHAFIRLWDAYESVLRRICLYFSRRHQRTSTGARKRSSAQDATKFNSVELSRFKPRTPAIHPIMYRCHELSVQRIELAITSVSSLVTNQLVASDSQRARDHSQSSVVTPRVNLSCSFMYRFSRHLIDFIPIDR